MTSSTAPASARPRVDALTGLRWFAALAVFFHHSARHVWLPDPIAQIMVAGSNGVTFFFILSGFVIALNYFDNAARPTLRGTWNFAVGRIARVYPAYLLVLVVVWLTLGNHSLVLRFLMHVLALQAWHPQLWVAYGLNAPGWSVGVEFFLYACFPLLALALRPIANRPKVLLAAALSVVILAFAAATMFQLYRSGLAPTDPTSAHRWLYRTPATRVGDFALGMIAALLLRHARSWTTAARDRLLSPLLTWLPLAATLLMMAWPDHSRYYASFDAMWMLPAVMLCFGLSLYPQAVLSRFLGTPAIVFLGEISFAFYLVHRPIMQALDAGSFGADSAGVYLAEMSLLLLLITVVAVACHFLWERPAQRLVNRRLKIKTRAARPLPGLPALAPAYGADAFPRR